VVQEKQENLTLQVTLFFAASLVGSTIWPTSGPLTGAGSAASIPAQGHTLKFDKGYF
jgi:hypothetical protein